jgi:Flp pilus assembly protein CpaB
MDTTSKLLLAVGAGLALLAGTAAFALVSAAQDLGRSTTQVVVARQQIPDRTLFTTANMDQFLATRAVPTDSVPEGALTHPAAAVGKTSTVRVAAGEIVLGTPDRLASAEGLTARPAAVIPRDKVALAIKASETVSVAGAIQPGDHVDVYATWNRGNSQSATRNIFQDVRVFAVGRWTSEDRLQAAAANSRPETITLLLDYQQASVLEYLIQTGSAVSLALRRFDQTEDMPTQTVMAESLSWYFGAAGSPAGQ